jgi:hypothetical protein
VLTTLPKWVSGHRLLTEQLECQDGNVITGRARFAGLPQRQAGVRPGPPRYPEI